MDWCRPFFCRGIVQIAGSKFPVTVLLDTDAQQSACRKVTGRKVISSEACVTRYHHCGAAEVTLSCPLVTTPVRMAVTDDLTVAGVDFLQGNDLAGGRVWVSTSTNYGSSEKSGKVVPDSTKLVTGSQARTVGDIYSRGRLHDVRATVDGEQWRDC